MEVENAFVYTEPNFQGDALLLKSSESFDSDRIILSASVPMDHTLTFFKYKDFQFIVGEVGMKNMCDRRPNISITFQSYILQKFNSPKYAIGTIADPRDPVVFYAEPFFKGDVLFKAYVNADYNKVNLFDMSSIYIPNGFYIDFYERDLKFYHSVSHVKATKELFGYEKFQVLEAYPHRATKCPEHKTNPFLSLVTSKTFLITAGVLNALFLSMYVYHDWDTIHTFVTTFSLKNLIPSILSKTFASDPFNFWLFVFVTVIFVLSNVLILIGPYSISDRSYMNFRDSLKKNYTRLNLYKTIVFLTLHVAFYVSCSLIILYEALQLKWLLPLIFILGSFWLLCYIYYMPCQTPFGLTNFGKPYKPQNNATHTVTNFLAIGDPQEFGNNMNRYKNNKLAVKTMNTFINETYPSLKQSNMTDIMACLIPGDCTQTGQDGRLFTNNYLGDYELRYGLGDNSDLNIPVYECTGNHDWDTTMEVNRTDKIYFKTCPAVNMIRRRNNHRSIVLQDKEGNYMCKLNNLYVIAVNCWPADENKLLLSGKPKGSLAFLQKAVDSLTMDDKFIILTHHVPIPYLWEEDDKLKAPGFYLTYKTLVGTPCERVLTILDAKKSNLLAMVLGHLHLVNAWTAVTDDYIRVIIPPAPANEDYKGAFVFFSYDDSIKKLSAVEIQSDGIVNQVF